MDEKINFDNVYIVIVLNDKGHIVQKVTRICLKALTLPLPQGHPKALHESQILGHVYSYWDYVVVSEYNIITKARLKLNEKRRRQLLCYLEFGFSDLSPVYAFMMTVRFDTPIGL